MPRFRPTFLMFSIAVTAVGRHQVWDGTGFPQRHRKGVIKIHSIAPTLPHTPNLQYRCFKCF